MWFANVFSHYVGYLCILLIVISAVQKCFSLMYSGLFCLFLLPGLWCHLHEIISKSNVIKIFLMFSSRSFTLSGLRFKSNPFWIDFCDGIRCEWGAFQVVLVVKNLPANAEDVGNMGSVPGSGRCPGGGHGNLPQYSCLKNPTDRGAWRATVHGVTKSLTWLKRLGMHAPKMQMKNVVCHISKQRIFLPSSHYNHPGDEPWANSGQKRTECRLL